MSKSIPAQAAKAFDYVAKHKADTESKVEALKVSRALALTAYIAGLEPEVKRAFDALCQIEAGPK